MKGGYAMPLLDHFHPPTSALLPSWESLHAGWTTHLAERLNEHWLPADFLATERTHAGHVEIDVATFERPEAPARAGSNGSPTTTLPRTWAPPAARCTAPLVFPDTFEVRITTSGGWDLVAAIELVRPANKDRPEERRAFAAKCAGYLHHGASVVLIDIITSRRANLHNEVMGLLGLAEVAALPEDAHLYAAAYRPVLREGRPEVDVWTERCAIGAPLPDMPLRLTGDLFVPVEFEATYQETCRRRRII
jgi:hypothetical protein